MSSLNNSIRLRLVLSYMLVTLVAVLLVGGLAIGLAQNYIRNQEEDYLNFNAEAIAKQAADLIQSRVYLGELVELVETASALGDVRVRLLSPEGMILADSGQPEHVDQFLLIEPPMGHFGFEMTPGMIVIQMHDLPPEFQAEMGNFRREMSRIFDDLPPETRFTMVERVPGFWGNRVAFEAAAPDEPGLVPDRSDRTVISPIQTDGSLVGYVELSAGPNFGGEALNAIWWAFVLSAAGAVLLAGLVGLFVANRLTRPLQNLSQVARQMGSGDLTVRAPPEGRDEIGQLANHFNYMASQLEVSFDGLSAERDSLKTLVADASHELRTPLTAIKNFLTLLAGPAGDDPQTRIEFLAESQIQVERMEWITQNILDLSRLEAGLVNLAVEAIEINGFLNTVYETFLHQAEEKEIRLALADISEGLTVEGDRMWLQSAMDNLVENAIKFTPNGGQVELGADQEEDGVRLWVRDTGIGIPLEDQGQVFERFYQVDRSGMGGRGLGLAMVEAIMTAHRGAVEVESQPGQGSRFSLIFKS